MEESGPSLNRDRLANARRLTRTLADRQVPKTKSQSQLAPRAGAVQEAVIEALAAAKGPLRAREVYAAAEALAATTLSWNTVKDCLHKTPATPTAQSNECATGSTGIANHPARTSVNLFP
jgi:hypothetical protein